MIIVCRGNCEPVLVWCLYFLVNPLIPADKWDWFCLDNVLYHGHNLTILWDKNGDRYHCGKGLRIFVDGKEVGQANTLTKIVCENALK